MDAMRPLTDIYKESFFSRRHRLSWRAPIVCEAVMRVLKPRSIVDVGCGIGDYVAEFQTVYKIDACGIEGSANCLPYVVANVDRIFIRDLREPLLMRSFDVAMCLEVLEHIEPEYVDQLVGNLSVLSDVLLVSAAPPGQLGHYHQNCQPKEYWHDRFLTGGYEPDEDTVEAIRGCWRPYRQRKEMRAYYDNLMFFVRRDDA